MHFVRTKEDSTDSYEWHGTELNGNHNVIAGDNYTVEHGLSVLPNKRALSKHSTIQCLLIVQVIILPMLQIWTKNSTITKSGWWRLFFKIVLERIQRTIARQPPAILLPIYVLMITTWVCITVVSKVWVKVEPCSGLPTTTSMLVRFNISMGPGWHCTTQL